MAAPPAPVPFESPLTLVGRSSSHFTRVARIFAWEARIDYAFRVVRDLMSCDSNDYAGNPALKLPILETPTGAWYGALNICRELVRRSKLELHVVWPEDLTLPLLGNAQELAIHAMGTEVGLIMRGTAGDGEGAHLKKMRRSLINTIKWLDDQLADVLAALPAPRGFSFLEVTLFCLASHLEFRKVLPMASYENLGAFCREFGARASVAGTGYRFDT